MSSIFSSASGSSISADEESEREDCLTENGKRTKFKLSFAVFSILFGSSILVNILLLSSVIYLYSSRPTSGGYADDERVWSDFLKKNERLEGLGYFKVDYFSNEDLREGILILPGTEDEISLSDSQKSLTFSATKTDLSLMELEEDIEYLCSIECCDDNEYISVEYEENDSERRIAKPVCKVFSHVVAVPLFLGTFFAAQQGIDWAIKNSPLGICKDENVIKAECEQMKSQFGSDRQFSRDPNSCVCRGECRMNGELHPECDSERVGIGPFEGKHIKTIERCESLGAMAFDKLCLNSKMGYVDPTERCSGHDIVCKFWGDIDPSASKKFKGKGKKKMKREYY